MNKQKLLNYFLKKIGLYVVPLSDAQSIQQATKEWAGWGDLGGLWFEERDYKHLAEISKILEDSHNK
jgi:hypothetical protein